VDGVNDFDVIPPSEADEGGTDLIEAAAKAFAPVRCDDDEFLRGISAESIEANKFACIESLLDVQDCVNAGISGDGDGGWVHAAAVEVLGGAFGGSEVKGGDLPGEGAVYFLGEWLIRIAGTEPCLNMTNWGFGIERAQRTAESSGGIALNEDDVWFLFGENRLQSGDDARGGLVEGLPRTHDVEVPVWGHVECVQNLVEHLAVLRGDADTDVEVIRAGLRENRGQTGRSPVSPETFRSFSPLFMYHGPSRTRGGD
jgi:hypothetical protein